MEHITHLTKDKKFKKIIELQEPYILGTKKNVYLHLCYSIMSQQLSTKVADVFHRRFLELYAGKEPTPEQIAVTPFETLRGIGLSNAKARYVHNVCNFFIEENISDEQLYSMNNEELIRYLTQIKGVGQWTVEMILMFTLGREDVFGLQNNAASNNDVLSGVMDLLIEIRKEAKTKRDFATSDKIRNQLASIGINLKDEKGGEMSWGVE